MAETTKEKIDWAVIYPIYEKERIKQFIQNLTHQAKEYGLFLYDDPMELNCGPYPQDYEEVCIFATLPNLFSFSR